MPAELHAGTGLHSSLSMHIVPSSVLPKVREVMTTAELCPEIEPYPALERTSSIYTSRTLAPES